MANIDAIELRVHFGFTTPTTIEFVGNNCEWPADDTTLFSPPTTLFGRGVGTLRTWGPMFDVVKRPTVSASMLNAAGQEPVELDL
jgi:hypothetical protein